MHQAPQLQFYEGVQLVVRRDDSQVAYRTAGGVFMHRGAYASIVEASGECVDVYHFDYNYAKCVQ